MNDGHSLNVAAAVVPDGAVGGHCNDCIHWKRYDSSCDSVIVSSHLLLDIGEGKNDPRSSIVVSCYLGFPWRKNYGGFQCDGYGDCWVGMWPSRTHFQTRMRLELYSLILFL